MLKAHQYIRKYVQKYYRERLVGKLSIGVVCGLLLLTIICVLSVVGTHTYTHTTCSKSDQKGCTATREVVEAGNNASTQLQESDNIVESNAVHIRSHQYNTPTVPPSQPHVQPTNTPAPVPTQPPAQPTNTPAPVPTQPVPTPVPTQPVPTQPAGTGITGMIYQIFGSAYGPGAVAIAQCESGLNPSAYNPSGASGLFQILPSTWAGTSQAASSPFNAYANAVAAHEIFIRDGYSWREWVC